ncbi:hypothetical protein ACFSO0_02470 [Brevibacillus sp. GCM10020057]|uniref:hypothetical protein n=1 Tax=Brevibacillus sp. GCM10020057 TaxID=3317327 RepID=UPI003634A369
MFSRNNEIKWVMTSLPILHSVEFKQKVMVPSLPFPVKLKYLGFYESINTLLFENVLLNEFPVEHVYSIKSNVKYVLVNKDNIFILDYVLKKGLTTPVWILEHNFSTAENEVNPFKLMHPEYGYEIEASIIDGIYVGEGIPEEVDNFELGIFDCASLEGLRYGHSNDDVKIEKSHSKEDPFLISKNIKDALKEIMEGC